MTDSHEQFREEGIDEALLRRMEEAAALEPHDPYRLEVMREVVDAGEVAERRWEELVLESERLRLALLRVDVPVGMKTRLKALPDGAPASHVESGWRIRGYGLAVAAVILLLVGGSLMLTMFSGLSVDERFEGLAASMLSHDGRGHGFNIQFTDEAKGELKAGTAAGFHVKIPTNGPEGYELLGAKVCHLDGKPVVCFGYKKGGEVYTVYQFCTKRSEVPSDFRERVVREVKFWMEDGCAYALVRE